MHTVTLRVLPASVVTTPAFGGSFTVLDFFSSVQPSMVYLERVLGPERTEELEQVAIARLRFDHLRSLALGPVESVVLIERVAETVWVE